jgi:hypothetical protein
MNSKQATNALNDLVSYRNQFDPQDWKDYLYDEAVSFQRQTKSKKPVEFLPEIWGLIKQFMIVFPSAEEAEAKRISGREFTCKFDPPNKNWFNIGEYQLDDYTELHRDITYIVNGVPDPVPIKNFFWIDTVKQGMNWRRGEKVWFRLKQNVDDFFLPFASKNEREVEWTYCIDEEGFVLAKTARVTFTGQEEATIGHTYETRVIERTVSILDCHYNNWWGRLTNRLPTQELVESTEIDTRS